MDPIETKPEVPQEENQTVAPEAQLISGKRKKFPKKLVSLVVVAVTIVVIGTLMLSGTVLKQSITDTKTDNPTQSQKLTAEPKAIEQVFVSSVDGSETNINESKYYAVVVGDTEYYGRVSKINGDYIRMLPTAYENEGVLTIAGKELHGPEAATYFRVSQVTTFQELTDNKVIDSVKAADNSVSDAFPSSDINEYIDEDRLQAYFFTDGIAFYAKTTSLDGNFLANSSHVYILQTSPEGSRIPTTQLVLADPALYNTRTSTDLAYWQNMKPDSVISEAAVQFEQDQQ